MSLDFAELNPYPKPLSVVNIKIRYEMRKQGFDVLELAREARLTSGAIEDFVNNVRNPTEEGLAKIAKALKVTPGYLLGKEIRKVISKE